MEDCNILITSIGRRSALLEYFMETFKGIGNVVVADCRDDAAALYIADKRYLVPRVNDPQYIDRLLEICRKENIRGVIPLIDPELQVIAHHRERFKEEGVRAVISSPELCMTFFDKYRSGEYCRARGINYPETFDTLDSFLKHTEGSGVYPVVVKPRHGSGSMDINIANTLEELEFYLKRTPDGIIQAYMCGEEYGVDAYVDMVSGELVSIFVKEKISMRAGETDKAKSVRNIEVENLVRNLISESGLSGPIDVDVMKHDGKYHVLEVNPRFGGGYPLAYECQRDFPKMILNNLQGVPNTISDHDYPEGVIMMKHDRVMIKVTRAEIE